MLTGQFRTYTPEEVREFNERLRNLLDQMCNDEHEKTGKLLHCNECSLRHICYDISSLNYKLKSEIIYGFPNSRKVK